MFEGTENVVVLHIQENGDMEYRIFGNGPVRVFTVDERAPHDRVYEHTGRDDPALLAEIIPSGSEIGSQDDDRHAAIEVRVLAALDGRKHLGLVGDDA